MASTEDTLGRLQLAKSKVDQAVQALLGAEADAEELQGQMVTGGVRDKAEAFASLKGAIGRARTWLAVGLDLVGEAVTQTGSAAGWRAAPPATGPPSAVRPGGGPPATFGHGARHGTGQPVPAFVRGMARRLYAPAGSKVGGVASADDGRALHDGVIVNGSRGARVDNASTLRVDDPVIPWRRISSVLTHVEGHTAALMREPGAPPEAVLVVTRPPCEGRDGCNALLPGVLPTGSRLHVYVADGNGNARFYKTYNGNGRGVAR